MNTHDVGRGRGGVAKRCGRVGPSHGGGGVLRPAVPALQGERIAAAPDGAPLRTITSDYGHDGFLIEAEQVGDVVRSAFVA